MLSNSGLYTKEGHADRMAELVHAAKRGNEDAFVSLMNEQKEKLYRMAFSFLRNEADALEAVQETTFRVYTKIGTLREPQYFATWVMRILMNTCTKELRRRNKHSRFDLVPERGGNEIDPERVSVETTLERLDPKYRQVIILKYFEDWTIRDIAKALQCPDSTIKTRLYEGLRRLRKTWLGEGEGKR